jgi:hypothetical protein
MTTVVQESKTFGQFLPTGTTPTTADMNNTMSNAVVVCRATPACSCERT